MLKRLVYILIALFLFIAAIAIRFFVSNTPFPEKSRDLLIYTGKATKEDVLKSLDEGWLIRNPKSFNLLAGQMDVWKKLKPGKYRIDKGMSLFEIARMLRNGRQTPVNLVITKLRT